MLVTLHPQWVQLLRSQARLLIHSYLKITGLKSVFFIKEFNVSTNYFFQGFLTDVLKCLGDNKKHMRECTLTTLDSWLSAVHLDKMVTSRLRVWECLRFDLGFHDSILLVGSLYCGSFDRHQAWC